MRLVGKILVAIGRPIYLLLRFILTRPQRKIRVKPTLHPVVIYQSPPGYLKSFLKAIYPWARFLAGIRSPRLPFFRQVFLLLTIGTSIYFYIFKGLPDINTLATQMPPLTTHIRDRHGVELYKIYSAQNRTLVKLADVPLLLRQATIAIEDAEFYQHTGFSIRGILRAVSRNLKAGRAVEGGSTITQQLVKAALLTPEQSLRRKLRELILAVAVETKYSKDQILETYLNRVGYGGATYGVEEAAQTYFGKSVGELTLAEGALLAGLPASPTTYSPFGAHPELAKARQKETLRRMVAEGFITWEQAEGASSEELHFAPQKINILAPHFVLYVKELLAAKYGTYVVEQGGLDVTTTLDLSLQQTAQRVVAEEINKVRYLHITNGAALVTNPATGEILAMVGSKNYFDTTNDGNVNVTMRLRQPGSSIKPVNYALAFSHGFTPASAIDDSPVTYRTPGQPNYAPVNYDGKYHGRVTLRTALASSYNIPAVKLLAANGVTNMLDLGQKMGITTWADPSRFGLSLTLGGGEVTMADMAVVYGTLANGGLKVPLQPILTVRDSTGRILEEFRCQNNSARTQDVPQIASQPDAGNRQAARSAFGALRVQPALAAEAATEVTNCHSEKVLDPRVAFMLSDILSDNTARTPAFGPNSDLNLPQVAVKTGTTNNLRDNWTIGYSPSRLVAVWVGNNDNSPMSYVASGVTGASPIWRKIITEVNKTSPTTGFSPPADLVAVQICTITGELACSGCPTKTEYFLPGTEPKRACTEEGIKKYLEEKARKEQEERDRILTGAATP